MRFLEVLAKKQQGQKPDRVTLEGMIKDLIKTYLDKEQASAETFYILTLDQDRIDALIDWFNNEDNYPQIKELLQAHHYRFLRLVVSRGDIRLLKELENAIKKYNQIQIKTNEINLYHTAYEQAENNPVALFKEACQTRNIKMVELTLNNITNINVLTLWTNSLVDAFITIHKNKDIEILELLIKKFGLSAANIIDFVSAAEVIRDQSDIQKFFFTWMWYAQLNYMDENSDCLTTIRRLQNEVAMSDDISPVKLTAVQEALSKLATIINGVDILVANYLNSSTYVERIGILDQLLSNPDYKKYLIYSMSAQFLCANENLFMRHVLKNYDQDISLLEKLFDNYTLAACEDNFIEWLVVPYKNNNMNAVKCFLKKSLTKEVGLTDAQINFFIGIVCSDNDMDTLHLLFQSINDKKIVQRLFMMGGMRSDPNVRVCLDRYQNDLNLAYQQQDMKRVQKIVATLTPLEIQNKLSEHDYALLRLICENKDYATLKICFKNSNDDQEDACDKFLSDTKLKNNPDVVNTLVTCQYNKHFTDAKKTSNENLNNEINAAHDTLIALNTIAIPELKESTRRAWVSGIQIAVKQFS